MFLFTIIFINNITALPLQMYEQILNDAGSADAGWESIDRNARRFEDVTRVPH